MAGKSRCCFFTGRRNFLYGEFAQCRQYVLAVIQKPFVDGRLPGKEFLMDFRHPVVLGRDIF